MVQIIKAIARKALRRLGYSVVPFTPERPSNTMGAPTIVGSFPPRELYARVGMPENYFIHEGYHPRTKATHYDDTANEDQWQLEVYQFAREILDLKHLITVCDIGCGSAHKLLSNFRDCDTVGIDVPSTCEYLRKKYPNRQWMDWNFNIVPAMRIDVVVASDVIEHLVNPNELLEYIQKLQPGYAVISTPDRNLFRSACHNGPPTNPAHIREWSFAEFDAYLSRYFEVEEHFISFPAQATQCALCRPREGTR
jgi:Methyltransferase domain